MADRRRHDSGGEKGRLVQDERDAQRPPGPRDEPAEIVEGVPAVGLYHGAELRPVGELRAERAQQLEGEVLHVVVFGVEVNRGAGLAGAVQDRTEPRPRLREPLAGGERPEVGGQRRRLDGEVDARGDAPGIVLETGLRRPGPGGADQRLEHRGDARRIAVGVGLGEGMLAEEIDRRRFTRAPEALQARAPPRASARRSAAAPSA